MKAFVFFLSVCAPHFPALPSNHSLTPEESFDLGCVCAHTGGRQLKKTQFTCPNRTWITHTDISSIVLAAKCCFFFPFPDNASNIIIHVGVCLLFWDHINITHVTFCNVLKPMCLTISQSGIFFFFCSDALIDKDRLWLWPLRCVTHWVWDWGERRQRPPYQWDQRWLLLSKCSAYLMAGWMLSGLGRAQYNEAAQTEQLRLKLKLSKVAS